MRIVIVGSMHFYRDMQTLKEALIAQGHQVFAPGDEQEGGYTGTKAESVQRKVQYNVFELFFKEIARSDAVLCYNAEKHATQGYIGANALIELGYGAALKKKLYVYFPLPQSMPYHKDELAAMNPYVCYGNPDNVGVDI